MAGHRGQVELDGEVKTGLARQVGKLVENLQGRRARPQLDGLLDADRVAVGMTGAFHHHGNSTGIALRLGQVGSRDEIASFDIAAGGKVVKTDLDRIEMIDESLAG